MSYGRRTMGSLQTEWEYTDQYCIRFNLKMIQYQVLSYGVTDANSI